MCLYIRVERVEFPITIENVESFIGVECVAP
jgi:hypothetical protein